MELSKASAAAIKSGSEGRKHTKKTLLKIGVWAALAVLIIALLVSFAIWTPNGEVATEKAAPAVIAGDICGDSIHTLVVYEKWTDITMRAGCFGVLDRAVGGTLEVKANGKPADDWLSGTDYIWQVPTLDHFSVKLKEPGESVRLSIDFKPL